jgi:FixJ family two-component response regulator
VNSDRVRVAVVDDEDSVRRAVARLIRSAGMDADVFESGEAFLAAVSLRDPDCVVLDLHMPGISGFEVQMRLLSSGLRLPVIAITGNDSPEAEERALGGGALAYLRKPIDKGTLIASIFAAVRGSVR